jgi:replicative DNA helicase
MIIPIGKLLPGSFEEIEGLITKKQEKTAILCGIEMIDKTIGGFHPGQLAVIFGSAKECQCGLCYSIAIGALKSKNLSVIIHSNSLRTAAIRTVAVATGIPIDDIINSSLKACLGPILTLSIGVFTETNIFFTDNFYNWEKEIKNCNELSKSDKTILIVEDLAFLSIPSKTKGPEFSDSMAEKVQFISGIAKSCQISVVANILLDPQTGSLNDKNANWMEEPQKIMGITDAGTLQLIDNKVMKKIKLTIHKNANNITGEFNILFDSLSWKCMSLSISDQIAKLN